MNENKSKVLQNIMIAVLAAIVIVLVIFNYKTFNKILFPPAPVIIDYKDNDFSAILFDNNVRVEATIRNDGGSGDIVFEATVYQDGNSWTKTLKKYFDSNETADMKIVFDEVNLMQGKIETSVKAYTDGK